VAARAAERITDEEITELRALGDEMTAVVRNADMLRYSELNAQLHSRIRVIAQHATATKITEQLRAQMVRHQFRLSLVPGRPSVSLPEHLAIVDAVCARDPERAERAMRAHLTSVIDMLSGFATAPDTPVLPTGEPATAHTDA
jgi:DNA-binding GntR family transcriptional regulator